MAEIKVDSVYEVVHVRKGTFTIQVTSVDDEWVTGVLLEGKVRLISSIISNRIVKGDLVTVRKTLAKFTEVAQSE